MRTIKKNNFIFLSLTALCMSALLVISCTTEPVGNEALDATNQDLGAKANPLANVTTSNAWHDSFEVNGKCYCKSTYDHGIGSVKVGNKTVQQICEEMKQQMQAALNGPGTKKYYNTVQCGHEPAHTDLTIQGQPDEVLCPGEVGTGIKCNSRKGPKWASNTPNPAPAPSGGPAGYTFASLERENVIVSGQVDIAYGANGKFFYKNNITNNTPCTNAVFGDPIPGVLKRCFVRPSAQANPTPAALPAGYVFASLERETVIISNQTVDIAYGANGKFFFKNNVSSNTPCTNAVFGDPIPQVLKKCYIKP